MYKQSLMVMVLVSVTSLCAQNTVGLLSNDPERALDGFTLFYPLNQPHVYLINNCGEIANQWSDEESFVPGNSAYLLENSNLVKTKRAAVDTNTLSAGGAGQTVEIRNWDNDRLWSYTLLNDSTRLHHDIEPMPNGNILMIAWEVKSREEVIAAGRNSTSFEETLWPDFVLEVDPDKDSIVWEWHAWDHLIQDLDSTKENFGNVSDHPELIDINFDFDQESDWMHCNAIDYHADLDQIMLCVAFFDEIWIIDHSTTTDEAASHSGGRSGSGGDLLYRWGNPQAYQSGVPEDQQLFFPHDAHWVGDLLEDSHPMFGQIAVLNNRIGVDFSAAHAIITPWNADNQSYERNGMVWGPLSNGQTITHPTATAFFSEGLGSVQFLPNRNVLLTSGRQGYLVEMDQQRQVVWEYKVPLRHGIPVAQGDTLRTSDNQVFHARRYPLQYPAFVRKPITDRIWIELDPDTTFCQPVTTGAAVARSNQPVKIYPNPANHVLTIQTSLNQSMQIEVFDLAGQLVFRRSAESKSETINVDHWHPGIYQIVIDGTLVKRLVVF